VLAAAAMPRPRSAANFAGGATAGCLSTLLLQPLEVVKTRQQVQSGDLMRAGLLNTSPSLTALRAHPNAGIVETMRRIVAHDSAAGLWRGVSPTIIRNTLGVGAYFTTLTKLTALLSNADGELSDGATLLAGATARSLAVCALCPLSVIKSRLELAEYATRYNGIADALRKIAAQEGITGLFRGLTPAIMRDAPYAALYLLVFLRAKDGMNRALGLTGNASNIGGRGRESQPLPPMPGAQTSEKRLQKKQGQILQENPPEQQTRPHAKQLGMSVNFLSGGLGGGLATLLTMPQDVVKTKMMVASRGPGTALGPEERRPNVSATIRAVLKEAGVRGFFRGAYPRFLKRMLGGAITWMVYEEAVSFYARIFPEVGQ
jgi:solute carrier family 25, member 38